MTDSPPFADLRDQDMAALLAPLLREAIRRLALPAELEPVEMEADHAPGWSAIVRTMHQLTRHEIDVLNALTTFAYYEELPPVPETPA